MRFIKVEDNLILNPDKIIWIEKADHGYWIAHLTDGKCVGMKSESLMKELEELYDDTARPERVSTGATNPAIGKLTEDVFDRDDCPEWAEYAAVDKDGVAYFFEREPHIGVETWIPNERVHRYAVVPVFESIDWKNSLIKRHRLS